MKLNFYYRQLQANESGHPQAISGHNEDKNVVPDYEIDINNNQDVQNDDNVNDHNEGGDVLIIGDSDNESFGDD